MENKHVFLLVAPPGPIDLIPKEPAQSPVAGGRDARLGRFRHQAPPIAHQTLIPAFRMVGDHTSLHHALLCPERRGRRAVEKRIWLTMVIRKRGIAFAAAGTLFRRRNRELRVGRNVQRALAGQRGDMGSVRTWNLGTARREDRIGGHDEDIISTTGLGKSGDPLLFLNVPSQWTGCCNFLVLLSPVVNCSRNKSCWRRQELYNCSCHVHQYLPIPLLISILPRVDMVPGRSYATSNLLQSSKVAIWSECNRQAACS